ncbi:hypothetical protein [Sulfobacillus thermosulfidooxidans]|uniref:hypothetical protein n=1 Tax=Sulfobacillus thermosulfidooxidans TaxID=28034 RepID=UPI003D6CC327
MTPPLRSGACPGRACPPVLDSQTVQVHGANAVIVRPVLALLTRKAVSALIAMASAHVSALWTGLRGLARIHGHRARLLQGGLIFDHLTKRVKPPRHGPIPIASPNSLRRPANPRQILEHEQRLGTIRVHECLTDLTVVFR